MNPRELAEQHFRLGNQYATQSHRTSGELSDAYSAVAEAHHQVGKALLHSVGEDQDDAPVRVDPRDTPGLAGLTAELGRPARKQHGRS